MKKIIINGIIVLAVRVLAQQNVDAQGAMTYVSNLGDTPTGASSVGSDSWLAAIFFTGNNSDGYMLDSVQLAMTDASGNPSGFSVMLYDTPMPSSGLDPGNSLATLNGSSDPVTAGTYTYTAPTDLTLSPHSYYFVVATAGTSLAEGAFDWSVTSTSASGFTIDHWSGENLFAESSDGLDWNYTSGTYGQFALNATAIPEPRILSLTARRFDSCLLSLEAKAA